MSHDYLFKVIVKAWSPPGNYLYNCDLRSSVVEAFLRISRHSSSLKEDVLKRVGPPRLFVDYCKLSAWLYLYYYDLPPSCDDLSDRHF